VDWKQWLGFAMMVSAFVVYTFLLTPNWKKAIVVWVTVLGAFIWIVIAVRLLMGTSA